MAPKSEHLTQSELKNCKRFVFELNKTGSVELGLTPLLHWGGRSKWQAGKWPGPPPNPATMEMLLARLLLWTTRHLSEISSVYMLTQILHQFVTFTDLFIT